MDGEAQRESEGNGVWMVSPSFPHSGEKSGHSTAPLPTDGSEAERLIASTDTMRCKDDRLSSTEHALLSRTIHTIPIIPLEDLRADFAKVWEP